MRANDAICGLVLIVFSVAMAVLTIPFPDFPGQKYGPDLLPRILAAGMTVCGILLIKRGLMARRQAGDAWFTIPAWTAMPMKVLRFGLVLASLVFYIVATDTLGFIPVGFVILLVLSMAFGARPLPALLSAAVATLMINYFFSSIMRVPLPRGLLDLVM
jgi:putative tricarboxylic transport membrane protein